jgi:aspartate aminotransferase
MGHCAGSAFGDAPNRLTLRIATPMLYGPDESRRWQALAATNPAALPWVADSLKQLERALESLGATRADTTGSPISPDVAGS